jgi:hypothetical protein
VKDRHERPGSLNGSGFSSTAFTTLKMALFAPIPSARVSTATVVKPGLFRTRLGRVSDVLNKRVH